MNTAVGFILPIISTPFMIMMFRQNARSFPVDIIEAARIDGLSEVRIFFQMFIPTMIVFFVLKKQFAEGITGAVK